MGHLGRSGIDAYENVYSVLILPKPSDLHLVQVCGLAQGAQDVSADQGVPLLTRFFLLLPVLSFLLLHWHRFIQIVIGELWRLREKIIDVITRQDGHESGPLAPVEIKRVPVGWWPCRAVTDMLASFLA